MKTLSYFLLRLILLTFPLLGIAQISSQEANNINSCSNQCCFTDVSPVGIMISHAHPKKNWMFSYRYMTMSMEGNRNGTTKVNDEQVYTGNYLMSPQNMRMDMHMIMAMYGLSDKITLMAMINFNVNSMKMSMMDMPEMSMKMMNMPGMTNPNMNMNSVSSGLGDTKIYALYNVLDNDNHHCLLNMGLSIPTGTINYQGNSESMYAGRRIPYCMQMGSGSYALLPGITYLNYIGSFTWSLQASSVVQINYNALGYKSGNEYRANAWAAYKWSKWISNSFRTEVSSIGSINGYDPMQITSLEPSANSANSGSQSIRAYGGVNFYFRSLLNSRLALEYGLPLYQNVNGLQLATQSSITAGWQVSF